MLEAIAKLDGTDRLIAEGLHRVVSEVAPDLVPKTYYGMPGYANAEGKIVVFTQPAGKFKVRYAHRRLRADRAVCDDGDMWPVALRGDQVDARVEKKERRTRQEGGEADPG